MTINRDTLEPGERLLWTGKPDLAGYCARRNTIGFAGLYPLIAGLALAAFQYATDSASALGAIAAILILAGVIMLCFPWRVAREARKASYGVTDRRAIIERPGLLLRNRISVPLAEVRRVDVGPGAVADVMFRDYTSEAEHGVEFGRDGFIAIREADKVGAMLRSAVEQATGKPV